MDRDTICVDFDGVVVETTHQFFGDGMDSKFAPLVEGAIESLKWLCGRYDVVIFTSRQPHHHDAIRDWLRDEHGVPVAGVTSEKVSAIAYIDDRAIAFSGDWDDALSQVKGIAR